MVIANNDVYRAACAIDHLDGLEAQVVIMKYLGGYSEVEIAHELEVDETEVRALAFRGLRQAKDFFSK